MEPQRAFYPARASCWSSSLDRSGLAPWLQVEALPAHVLEVWRNLLAGGKVQGLTAKATGLVNVPLPDVRGSEGGH